MRHAALALVVLLAAAADAAACDLEQPSQVPPCTRAAIDRLPLNALQLIGTHNSYKQAMPADELAAHRAVDAAGADGLDYAHPPLAAQLDRGVRVLELDVYLDPRGGRYLSPPGAHRRGYTRSPWSGDDLARMRAPGFKVMHLQDIDFRSSCVTFVQCLREVRDWSQAHPWHAPIMISVNAKDGAGGVGATPALAFDAAAFDALDAEIHSVLDDARLFRPAQLRGDQATLRDAVRAHGWPTLGAMRGKVILVLDEAPRKRATYRSRRADPAMFVASNRIEADSALLVLNDPVGQRERIAEALAAGQLVRTRADADTREARAGDVRRREAAFASGAQFISTDYPRADRRWPGYSVAFPEGGYVRCRPSHPACAPLQEP
ncbi:MAG TPA: Ca2+-dependent phosphoinositide-specific phospholipase C [Lysobacter sp.]